MLQVMDLARENAALKRELERARDEVQALRLLVPPEDDHGERALRPSAFGSLRTSESLAK